MRSGNPALSEDVFNVPRIGSSSGSMTVGGTAFKTFLFVLVTAVSAFLTWRAFPPSLVDYGQGTGVTPPLVMGAVPWLMGGAIGGLFFGLMIAFVPTTAAFLGWLYAICEGVVIGAITATLEARYPGITFQAAAATFGTLIALLFAYMSGLVRATENFKLGVIAATGGILLVYLVSIVLQLFGVRVGFIHEGGLWGILFSVFVVVIAALNLVLDFDFIDQGAQKGAPKYMEWYGAFGLLVTLVWLYLEILRLIAKARSK